MVRHIIIKEEKEVKKGGKRRRKKLGTLMNTDVTFPQPFPSHLHRPAPSLFLLASH
jgi:hypothetical protein